MTNSEFENLQNNPLDEIITVANLKNTSDRTLLYGYTCDRHTFHVYLKDGKIHIVIYKCTYVNNDRIGEPIEMREISISSNYDYVPDKRVYPEPCDYEFCKLLVERNINIPFLYFDVTRNFQKVDGEFLGFTL